jgi:hypothetical protein
MKPGEAEKIATFLNISVEELFRDYLNVDWWERGDDPIFVLSPGIGGEEPGTEFPFVAKGRCVFLKDGLCSIHAVKPFECGEAWCADGPVDRSESAHKKVADAWDAPEHQAQITTLLGRTPKTDDPDGFSLFDMLLGGL